MRLKKMKPAANISRPMTDHLARAQLVHAPAGDGAHHRAFHAGEGEGPGKLRGGPVEVLLQDGHPEGERLEKRHRPDDHDHGADDGKPPPIEHAPHQPHRVGELTYLQQQGTPSLDYDNRKGERCFSQTSRDIILHPVLYWCFRVVAGTDTAPECGPRMQGYWGGLSSARQTSHDTETRLQVYFGGKDIAIHPRTLGSYIMSESHWPPANRGTTTHKLDHHA